MLHLHTSLRSAMPWLVLATAAVAIAGCDRPAASQSPSPGRAKTANAETAPESKATGVNPAASDSVAPAVAATELPSGEPATGKAPPSSDGPPRPVGLRPKADRGTTADGVEKITFD